MEKFGIYENILKNKSREMKYLSIYIEKINEME